MHIQLQHRLQRVGNCGKYVISKLGGGWHDQSYHRRLCSSAKAVQSAFPDESSLQHIGHKNFFQGEFSVLVQEVQNWHKLNTQRPELNELGKR